MHINTIRKKAKLLQIDAKLYGKDELIRAIQEKEGYTPCFKTGLPSCDQLNCCWRKDCQPGQIIPMV
nr:hypothetical protein [uncultured Desulfobulbus sp.]